MCHKQKTSEIVGSRRIGNKAANSIDFYSCLAYFSKSEFSNLIFSNLS